MKKKVLKFFLLFSLFLIFLFYFPEPSEAFIGTGLFDYFQTALEGVEEKAAPIARKIIIIFFTAFIGIILLLTSATLLQWIIENPEWLTLKNPVVESGLYFTTGLVNLFIILFFVAIAIAWILKIETFATKKALPKLIIVALLVNFVRIFVGIPIDIATIIHRTLLDAAGRDFFWQSIDAIYGGLYNMLIGLGGWILTLTGLFMIPFVSPFAQYGLVVFVAGMIIVFGPVLIGWIAQLVLSYLLAMLFFSLAFLFACRIYIIWFLTIFAPLAFLCMVLPQTRKWWDQWLHHLFSWVFFGLIVLLFLVVGLRGAQYLRPGGLQPTVPGMYWFSLPEYFSYYFFLFVFLAVTTWLSKKTAPEMADHLINYGKMFGGMLVRASGPVVREARRTAAEVLQQQEERERKAREKAEREGKKWEKLKRGEKIRYLGRGGYAAGLLTKPIGWAYRVAGITAGEELRRRMQRAEKEGERIKDPELLAKKVKWAMQLRDLISAIGYLTKAIERGGGFKKAVEREIKVEDALKIAERANAMGATTEAERIVSTYIHKIKPEKREEELRKIGFKSFDDLTEEEKREWRAKGYETITDKIIGDIKPRDVKNLGRLFWEDKNIMRAVQKFWEGPQLARAAEEFGRSFVDAYMSVIEKLSVEEQIRINPKAALYRSGNAAQDLGFRSPAGLGRREIREIIRRMEEEEKRKGEGELG